MCVVLWCMWCVHGVCQCDHCMMLIIMHCVGNDVCHHTECPKCYDVQCCTCHCNAANVFISAALYAHPISHLKITAIMHVLQVQIITYNMYR